MALYLTGLLALLWAAVVRVVDWVRDSVFDLTAWVGFGVLALCVVLWVVGGVVARRSPRAVQARKEPGQRQVGGAEPARPPAKRPSAPTQQDDDMAEIEALLKSRGIQ